MFVFVSPSTFYKIALMGLKSKQGLAVEKTKHYEEYLHLHCLIQPQHYLKLTAQYHLHVLFLLILVLHTIQKGSSKSFPKHETIHVSEHKNVAICARFSPHGRFLASGSADTSIKLFEVTFYFIKPPKITQ